MKKKIVLILYLVAPIIQAQTIDTQDIEVRVTLPEVSLISIEPENSTIYLVMENTQNAGDRVDFVSKSKQFLWLNYTCSLAPNSPSKNLLAQIISGSVPEGLELQLKVNEYSGSGKGQFGIPISTVSLQEYPQIIITNIGGSFTNQGINQGHQLEYQLEITNYKRLDSEKSNTLTIVYTLTDN